MDCGRGARFIFFFSLGAGESIGMDTMELHVVSSTPPSEGVYIGD